MLEKLKGIIIKNIVKILLLASLVIYVISVIIAITYDIPTYNSKEAIIMMDMISIPSMIGLWIHSHRIKSTRKRLSILIKGAIIYVFCILLGFNIWLL